LDEQRAGRQPPRTFLRATLAAAGAREREGPLSWSGRALPIGAGIATIRRPMASLKDISARVKELEARFVQLKESL